MRLGSPGCEIVSSWLSEMGLLKFLVKINEGSDTLQLPSVSLCASTTFIIMTSSRLAMTKPPNLNSPIF